MTGKSKLPSPRQAQLVKLINPASKEVLDHALSLWFPGRKLFFFMTSSNKFWSLKIPIMCFYDCFFVFYNIFSKSWQLAIFGKINRHIGSCFSILIVNFENSHNLMKTKRNFFGRFRNQNWLLVGLVVEISWARYYSPVPLLGFWNYGCLS